MEICIWSNSCKAIMRYIKLVIEVSDKYQESLITELFDMGFDGFEQKDRRIIAYITKKNLGISDRERIDQLLAAYPGDGYIVSEEVVADQNWNEQWEQTVKAQSIGSFFVKPTWSRETVPEDKILLEIDPKMSFGTGYHETTRLMLTALPDIVRNNDTIIDAGTGTGILSIAGIKLGARQALAFDVDEWSISNAKENILLNNVADAVTIKKGSVEVIPEGEKVDIILANIERNTLLELMEDFERSLVYGGHLLLSGLLKKDKKRMLKEIENRFNLIDIHQRNEWIAIHAEKTKQ